MTVAGVVFQEEHQGVGHLPVLLRRCAVGLRRALHGGPGLEVEGIHREGSGTKTRLCRSQHPHHHTLNHHPSIPTTIYYIAFHFYSPCINFSLPLTEMIDQCLSRLLFSYFHVDLSVVFSLTHSLLCLCLSVCLPVCLSLPPCLSGCLPCLSILSVSLTLSICLSVSTVSLTLSVLSPFLSPVHNGRAQIPGHQLIPGPA